jgi:hypothetical protein
LPPQGLTRFNLPKKKSLVKIVLVKMIVKRMNWHEPHIYHFSNAYTNNLLFLAIKLPENSNEILKTDLTKEMDFEKVFEKRFFMKQFLKINCTNRVPLGVPICFHVSSANYGLVLIITSEIELEISGACCAEIFIEKRF